MATDDPENEAPQLSSGQGERQRRPLFGGRPNGDAEAGMYACESGMYAPGRGMYAYENGMYAGEYGMYACRGAAYGLGRAVQRPAAGGSAGVRGCGMVGALGEPPWAPARPLQVAHISAALVPAGIEYWLAALRRYANPSYLQFQKAIILSDWVDHRQVARMGMPVEVGGRQSVVHAARHCDVLLISDPGGDAAQVGQWILEAKPPLSVFVAHGDGSYTRDRLNGIGSAVDHIVAVTKHVQREVCGNWPSSVILNGVDPHRVVKTQPRSVSRHRFGLTANDFVVGFVGRFSEEKNPQLVVEAVSQLPNRYKVMLVGHGYMRDELLQQCLRLLPGRFILVEGDGDLGDLYACMDTLVMPSRLEGYGLVAMEAMMAGVPVIATPFGVVADLVTDRVDGLVVSPCATEIAKAAFQLGEHAHFRRSIIAGARELANRSGYASQMAREYERLLGELWDASQGASRADR